jgi:hypothetical protein
MWLSRRSAPFDSDDYIYELKIDGFRSLAYTSRAVNTILFLAMATPFATSRT